MVALALLLVLGIIGIVVGLSRRRKLPGGSVPPEPPERELPPTPPTPQSLEAELAGWVAAGLLSADQSAAILAHEQAKAAAVVVHARARRSGQRIPLVAEALGYLGGTLAVAGLVLLVSRYWPDMATGARLGLSGGAAVLLLVGGAVVHVSHDSALARLRAVLWLAATAATAVFVVIAVRDGMGVTTEKRVVLAGAAGVAIESALLWWGRNRPVQQLSFLAAITVFLGAAVAQFFAPPGPPGLAVWIAGAAILFTGLRRYVQAPVMSEAFGAVAVFVGAIMVANRWQGFGMLLAVASALALLVLAMVPGLAPQRKDQLALGILGAIGLFQVPGTLGYFSQDAGAATGLTAYAVGAVLLFVGGLRLVRLPVVVEVAGGVTLLVGAALSWTQWHGFAPIFGAGTAVGLVALGMLRDRLLLSVLGSVGMLVNVPWIIVWVFAGEGRVPLLTLISGALILAIAVLLARQGGRHHRAPAAPAHHP
ncbi:MAG: DUF2157 domain-containing protein [Mycobacteriaceae bacterium]